MEALGVTFVGDVSLDQATASDTIWPFLIRLCATEKGGLGTMQLDAGLWHR